MSQDLRDIKLLLNYSPLYPRPNIVGTLEIFVEPQNWIQPMMPGGDSTGACRGRM